MVELTSAVDRFKIMYCSQCEIEVAGGSGVLR